MNVEQLLDYLDEYDVPDDAALVNSCDFCSASLTGIRYDDKDNTVYLWSVDHDKKENDHMADMESWKTKR